MALQSQIEKLINLDKIIEDLSTDKVLKVGWPEAIRYPEEEGGKYVAEVAAQNEYGAPLQLIPARPFMGPAVANNKTKWLNTFEKGAKRVVNGHGAILDVLELTGAQAAGDVAKAIKEVTSPPLSLVTIQARFDRLKSPSAIRKGITPTLEKPLIDTGIMLRSVTYAVESE